MSNKINFQTNVDRFTPSVVLDYNVLQGVTHPADLTVQPIRNYNFRYVTIENSSPDEYMGISIMDSFDRTPTPPVKFILAPGEIRHIGINTIGEQIQWLHMLDIIKNPKGETIIVHAGDPYAFRTDANSFVLRDGINKWWVQAFHRPSYNASF
jgi:hypothetical protein